MAHDLEVDSKSSGLRCISRAPRKDETFGKKAGGRNEENYVKD